MRAWAAVAALRMAKGSARLYVISLFVFLAFIVSAVPVVAKTNLRSNLPAVINVEPCFVAKFSYPARGIMPRIFVVKRPIDKKPVPRTSGKFDKVHSGVDSSYISGRASCH